LTVVRWTPQGATDLEAIRTYIERDSPYYAQLMMERILDRVDQLEMFPFSGRVVPEVDRSDVRELIERPFRIVYRWQEELIWILTIFHSSRQFPEITLGSAEPP
jgi:plasmid stabilization system protein ParE